MFTINCLVDNKTLDPALYEAEFGVSFSIHTTAGSILFDTGLSGSVLVHNAVSLGIDLGGMNALVLSHAHYDHTGGLQAFMQYSQPGLPLYALADIFRPRFSIKEGKTRSIGMTFSQNELSKYFNLHLGAEAVEVLPHIWTTGEITPREEFLGSSPTCFIQGEDGWQPDPYRDDMAMVLEGRSGLVVICGCCHAGILNTLAQVQRKFNREIIAIVGGAHLAYMQERTLQHAIESIRTSCGGNVPDLYLNHCTGEHAIETLKQAFGGKVRPYPAGTVLVFD